MICVVKLLGVLTTCMCTQALPIGCSEDAHCPSGFYCETSQLFCRECLQCEDLKRQPAPTLASCITSVTECGPCFSGLVQDKIDNHCVPPDSGKQLLLPYEWAVIAVSLFLAILVCAAAAYILRNFNTFKIRASTRTSVRSPGDDTIAPASAPQPPPPYNVVAAVPLATQSEESLPFIKPISSPSPHWNETRESAGSQSARVFNNPSYVRTFQPSYEIPTEQDETLPAIQENIPDNEQNISANSMVLESEAEGSTTKVLTPVSPTKLLRTRQDSSRNKNAGDDNSRQPPLPHLAHSGTAFVINVIKNVNTVQQQNELMLW